MQWRAVFHLGQRMAWRNNLFLFAWLCALVVPLVLQLIAGLVEEFRHELAGWYGVPSLYMLFTMTYGFATVFISYYQASGYRKAGTIDLLRVASFRPAAVLWGAFWQLQVILGPPVIAFCAGLVIYAQFDKLGPGWLRELRPLDALAVLVLLLLIQALLSSIPLTGLFKRGEILALVCLPVVLPLNLAPMFLSQSRGWAGLVALSTMLGLLLLTLGGAWLRLQRMWPPQRI
jgi:hypothetical protein